MADEAPKGGEHAVVVTWGPFLDELEKAVVFQHYKGKGAIKSAAGRALEQLKELRRTLTRLTKLTGGGQ